MIKSIIKIDMIIINSYFLIIKNIEILNRLIVNIYMWYFGFIFLLLYVFFILLYL